jgi:hypothetical protein
MLYLRFMKTVTLILLMAFLIKAHAAEDIHINPTNSLEQSTFCAICELVETGSDNKSLTAEYPEMKFFRLRPVKIYWGSYDKAKSSLQIHPVLKGEGKTQIMVVFRGNNNLGPGDWLKSYIPIQKDSRPPTYYLLSGKGTVSGGDLKRFLDQYSKLMRKKFPLDKKK